VVQGQKRLMTNEMCSVSATKHAVLIAVSSLGDRVHQASIVCRAAVAYLGLTNQTIRGWHRLRSFSKQGLRS